MHFLDVPNAKRCLILLAGTATLLGLFLQAQADAPGSDLDRMSTPERVHQEAWWPTKLLPGRKNYVGSEACAGCHAAKAATAGGTEMGRALLLPKDADVLREKSGATFELDSFHYKLDPTPQGYSFTVSKDGKSETQPISWAFGDGNISQVYLTERDGKFYESHFSYYGGTHGFDRTTNQERPADTMASAIGRVVSSEEARRCFVCHASAVTATGGYADIEAGVICEACHGPGADHAAAMRSGLPGGEGLIMNPKHLSPTASVDFCGACHMTWVDVGMGDVTGTATTRFPAYGLMNSRCWGNGDARITCVGCHDPHVPLVRGTAKYDGKCLACHVVGSATPTKEHPGKACPTATGDCASCHMPRVEFVHSHHSFTDHNIRVVRAGEEQRQ